jgi:hypothetical protein
MCTLAPLPPGLPRLDHPPRWTRSAERTPKSFFVTRGVAAVRACEIFTPSTMTRTYLKIADCCRSDINVE